MLNSSAAVRSSTLISTFYPALDGMRAVAFLMVFAMHYGLAISGAAALKWGWIGVDVFFVLSGFLITGILFDSLDHQDYFKTFYTRRALRIFPLFYGLFVLLFLLTPLLHIRWNLYNLSNLVYLGNFFRQGSLAGLHADPGAISFVTSSGHREHTILIGHLWSLCVEEQFYLLWPAVVWFVRSRRALLGVCLTTIFVVLAARIAVFLHDPAFVAQSGLNTYSLFRVDSLLVGAAIALWLRGDPMSVASLRKQARAAMFGAPLLLAIGFMAEGKHPVAYYNDPFIATLGYTLIALAAGGAIVLALDERSVLYRHLTYRPLISMGRISYGMYVFHALPAAGAARLETALRPHHLAVLVPLAAFAYTYIVAKLSFKFLESPFLRLKSRLAPSPGTVSDPPPSRRSRKSTRPGFLTAHP